MNKNVIREINQLAKTLPPLYHEVEQRALVKGITILDQHDKQTGTDTTAESAKSSDGRLIDPNKFYEQKAKAVVPVNYKDEFRKAYKKGGMQAVQNLFNHYSLTIQQQENEKAIMEATAELTQPAEA